MGAVRKSASSLLPKDAATANKEKPKDRGVDQRDVDGPSECSSAQGMVAAEARVCAPGSVRATHCTRGACTKNIAIDILCHPLLVLPYQQAFDTANAQSGAKRNPQKTEVIYHVADLDAAPPRWRINGVRFYGCSWTRHTWSCTGTSPVCCRPTPGKRRRHPRFA